MKRVAIIQARMSSSRLPGKILKKLSGKPVIVNIVERVSRSGLLDEVIIATSDDPSDDIVQDICGKEGIRCFRGSLDNVLSRFYYCALQYKADVIVRLTADNPFVSSEIIDNAIQQFDIENVDYLSYKVGLPLGMGVEVFSFKALQKAFNEAKDKECIEHVTPYIFKNPSMFKAIRYSDANDTDHSDIRLTMDTPEDYCFASKIYDHFGSNAFTYEEVIKVLSDNPEWMMINSSIPQNSLQYSGEKKD